MTSARSRRLMPLLCVGLCVLIAVPVGAQEPEDDGVVRAIRVHGNRSLADATVIRIAGVRIGDTASVAMAKAERRLRESGRFATVEVLRRYRSLSDPTDVVLVLRVREKLGAASKLLAMPEISYNEDERFSAGARVAAKDLLGAGELIAIPVSWGGVDRAALEVSRSLAGGFRVAVLGETRRVHNRHFRVDDTRRAARLALQLPLVDHLRARAHAGYENVTFGDSTARQWRYGIGLRLDTRPDVAFPYDALVLAASIERVARRGASPVRRVRLEAAAYRTLVGPAVLAVGGRLDLADAPLPLWDKRTIGGMVSLRGHAAGAFAGDSAGHATVELRLPLTRALSVARLGVIAFWDLGAAWDHGVAVGSVRYRHGVGGGVFLVMPLLRLNVDVGSDLRGTTRLHLGLGFRF